MNTSAIHNHLKPRIDYIDLAKGFCIILVVLYHVGNRVEGGNLEINSYFRIFRMPLYFFLSGLFFKEYEGVIGFLKRKINKLLIPFLFWYALFNIALPVIKMIIDKDYELVIIKVIQNSFSL